MAPEQDPKYAELSAFDCDCNTTLADQSKPKNPLT